MKPVVDMRKVEAALKNIARSSMRMKQQIVEACYECLTYDKEINRCEAEIFRTIAEAFDIQLPPWQL